MGARGRRPLLAPAPRPGGSAGEVLTPPSRSLSLSFPVPRALQTCPADGRRGSRRRAPATSSSEYRLPAPHRPSRAGGRCWCGSGPGPAQPGRPRAEPARPPRSLMTRAGPSGTALRPASGKVGSGRGGMRHPPSRAPAVVSNRFPWRRHLSFPCLLGVFVCAFVCELAAPLLPAIHGEVCGRWSVAGLSAGRGGR